MAQKVLSLPLRIRQSIPESSLRWTCRRCLATQQISSATTAPPEQSTRPIDNPDYNPTLRRAERSYPLTKTDHFLKKALGQRIPNQYLEHSTSPLLPEGEASQRERISPSKQIIGIVVSANKMSKTVKVRVAGQRWEKKIGKYFTDYTNHLVHDPNDSLVAGDVVSLHKLKVSKTVLHVVASIVAPFGTPVEARPPIPTPDERLAKYKEKRFAKLERRKLEQKVALGSREAIEMRIGNKGQKLAPGVLPGGKHEVRDMNARSKQNKEKAIKLEEQAVDNLAEAEVASRELGEAGLGTDPKTSTTIEPGRSI